jgi:hypothetical protein
MLWRWHACYLEVGAQAANTVPALDKTLVQVAVLMDLLPRLLGRVRGQGSASELECCKLPRYLLDLLRKYPFVIQIRYSTGVRAERKGMVINGASQEMI